MIVLPSGAIDDDLGFIRPVEDFAEIISEPSLVQIGNM